MQLDFSSEAIAGAGSSAGTFGEEESATVYGGGSSAAVTVTLLTYHLAALIRHDEVLQDIWVRGEVSSIKRAASGHVYFSVQDEGACLNCVMWRSAASRSSYLPDAGAEVLLHGRLDLHLSRGQYQLVVDDVRPAGAGALHAALERLKQRLGTEGLLAPERKRPIPTFPRNVAVVTSLSGAVLHDIRTTLERQAFPPALLVVPTQVQGVGAEESIAAALAQAGATDGVDLVILARGGGSAEDLWTFNTEVVARAISACPVPVISAVGHETDFTLADMVADYRAATPTAAAELVAALRGEMAARLEQATTQLRRALLYRTETLRMRWEALLERSPLARPQVLVERRQEKVRELDDRLARAMERQVEMARHRLALTVGRLESVSPLATLARGYATVTRLPEKTAVRHTEDLKEGDSIRIRLTDGLVDATVTQTHQAPLVAFPATGEK